MPDLLGHLVTGPTQVCHDPGSPVAAYCAPGLAGYATRLLDTCGVTYREVFEDPLMTGRTDVILATAPPGDGWPAGTRLRLYQDPR